MDSWRDLVSEAFDDSGDSWSEVIAIAGDLDRDPWATGPIPTFTVWTTKRVYFPVQYDGDMSVGSVSRAPDGRPTPAFGG